jgi:hypothetical protein
MTTEQRDILKIIRTSGEVMLTIIKSAQEHARRQRHSKFNDAAIDAVNCGELTFSLPVSFYLVVFPATSSI